MPDNPSSPTDSSQVSQRHQRRSSQNTAQQHIRRRRRCSVSCHTLSRNVQEGRSPRMYCIGIIRYYGPARDDRTSFHLTNIPMPGWLFAPCFPGGLFLLSANTTTSRFLNLDLIGRGAARSGVGFRHEEVVREVVQRIGYGRTSCSIGNGRGQRRGGGRLTRQSLHRPARVAYQKYRRDGDDVIGRVIVLAPPTCGPPNGTYVRLLFRASPFDRGNCPGGGGGDARAPYSDGRGGVDRARRQAEGVGHARR